jgi:hypothetical protein
MLAGLASLSESLARRQKTLSTEETAMNAQQSK